MHCPNGNFENAGVLPIVIILHISLGFCTINQEGRTLPIIIVMKHANINPIKYINPLKSWLNIDANEKNDTNINGAKRKNKYNIVNIFNSILLKIIL